MKQFGLFFAILVIGSTQLFAQIVNIPDENFLNALIEAGVDTDKDGQISEAEAEVVTTIQISAKEISDMTGIEYFTSLEIFFCDNNLLTSLDVSNNLKLDLLICFDNQLDSLDLTSNTDLSALNVENNSISTLDLSHNNKLGVLYCSGNQIAHLDLSGKIALTTLICGNNQLGSLDVTQNPDLHHLICSSNQIAELNLLNNLDLHGLRVDDNPLSSLDLSNNVLLGKTEWGGYWETFFGNPWLDLSDMKNLHRVCLREGIMYEAPGMDTTGSPNLVFTTDCSTLDIRRHQEISMSIYPNPATDYLTISTKTPGPHLIEITSITGRLLQTLEMEGSTQMIDLSFLQAGIYFIGIRSGDLRTTQKVIVM